MGHSTDINENEHLQYIFNDYKSGIEHGILVANLTYELAKRLKLDERECYELKIAGMMHDIGKLKLSEYLYGRNSGELSVEEMKYMRMHSKISFDVLKNYDYSDNIMKVVLYHHECFDGSGYPDNLKGTDIPLGARILKVTDEFAALISDLYTLVHSTLCHSHHSSSSSFLCALVTTDISRSQDVSVTRISVQTDSRSSPRWIWSSHLLTLTM